MMVARRDNSLNLIQANMFNRPTVIRIDIPALDALLAYIREKDTSQQQIATLTDRVNQLIGRLAKSEGKLADAVNQEHQESPHAA